MSEPVDIGLVYHNVMDALQVKTSYRYINTRLFAVSERFHCLHTRAGMSKKVKHKQLVINYILDNVA